jgi:hypothetical protein
MKTIKTTSILLLSLLASQASFQTLASETLDSHEHGSASLLIAIDNNMISIRFESPAVNIIGFEYQPSSEEQLAMITAAKNKLSNFDTSYKLQGEPDCLVLGSSASWVSEHDDHSEHGNDIAETKHDDHSEHGTDIVETAHDDHSEHQDDIVETKHDDHSGHENDTMKAEHAEFLVEFELQCERVDNLTAIDVPLLAQFLGIDEIDAQVIYSGGQIKQELTPNNALINLNN